MRRRYGSLPTPTPEILLMQTFPTNIPWAVTLLDSGDVLGEARDQKRVFPDWRVALHWVAQQLQVRHS